MMPSEERERRGARRRRAQFATAACVVLIAGCGDDDSWNGTVASSGTPAPAPSATIAASPGPKITSTTAKPGTSLDLGDSREFFCAIQSLEGRLQTYGSPESPETEGGTVGPDASDSDATTSGSSTVVADAAINTNNAELVQDAGAPEGDGGSTLATQVMLYLDPESGHWTLSSEGAVRATVGCVAWSAFGGAPKVSQVFNPGDFIDPTRPSEIETLPSGDCFLTGINGDFGGAGQTATIGDAGFVVSRPLDDEAWAQATCFSGTAAVPFSNVNVTATTSASSAALPAANQAFCALSAIGAMNSVASSVSVNHGSLDAVNAIAAVRCFDYTSLPDD